MFKNRIQNPSKSAPRIQFTNRQYKVHGIKTSTENCFYFDLVNTHDKYMAPVNPTSLIIIEEVDTFSGCLPPEAVTQTSVENSQQNSCGK